MSDRPQENQGHGPTPRVAVWERLPRPAWAGLVALLLAALLYVPGIRWGLPNTDSWSQDTIAGMRTPLALHEWPGHFLTDAIRHRPTVISVKGPQSFGYQRQRVHVGPIPRVKREHGNATLLRQHTR